MSTRPDILEPLSRRSEHSLRTDPIGLPLLAALSLVACGGDGRGALPPASVARFAVGGTVSGLAGSGLTLQNNAGDNLVVAANGTYVFTAPLASGAIYNVTVFNQPISQSQTCVVSNPSGFVGTTDVTDVFVRCGVEPEGVYSGSMTGSGNAALEMLILENGEYWALLGTRTAAGLSVSDFIQGTGTANEGHFTSADAIHITSSPAASGTLNATYDLTARTISGTVTDTSGNFDFSGGPVAGSFYDYDAPATLSTLVGGWEGIRNQGILARIQVSPEGHISAASIACSFQGTIAPRPTGKNVYNVTGSFGISLCSVVGPAWSGIALAYPLASGQTAFMMAVIETTRRGGIAFSATR